MIILTSPLLPQRVRATILQLKTEIQLKQTRHPESGFSFVFPNTKINGE